jgi:hypothetical protein
MSDYSREKYQSLILLILLSIAILFIAGYVTKTECSPPERTIIEATDLPSLIDIQKRLNEIEPRNSIKPDGIYGPATKAKWDRVYGNEQAKKYIEGRM